MSGDASIPQAKLGLSDTNIDPEILTKEIDHNFFDDPPEATDSVNIDDCQQGAGGALMPNPDNVAKAHLPTEIAPMEISGFSQPFPLMRSSSVDAPALEGLDEGMGMRLDKSALNKSYYYHDESGRSSSNVTLHLEMEKANFGSLAPEPSSSTAGKAAAQGDFFSIHQSNATSPNYPRPKQCYQLQQRRRSFGSIRKTGRQEPFQPMNNNDCGLVGQFDDIISSSSSSSSSSDSSDLSDSSESELESFDSDDEEFVDMLEKYFDYIDQDSDCSDLTEVSPLSSLAASPLPNHYLASGIANIGLDENSVNESLCAAAANLRIVEEAQTSSESNQDDAKETGDDSSTYFEQLVDNDPFFADCRPKICNLPLIISTTETVIVSAAPKEVNGAKGNPIVWPDVTKKERSATPEEHCYKGGSNEEAKVAFDTNVEIKDAKSADASSAAGGAAQLSPKEEACSSSRSSSSGCWSSTIPSRKVSAHSSASASSSSASSSFGSHNGGASSRKKRPSKNYTFTSDQMRKIERENHILLRKIIDTHNRGGHKGKNGVPHGHNHGRSSSSSASIARLRQQKRIEQENSMMMKRLQSVKPSKEIGEVFNNQAKN